MKTAAWVSFVGVASAKIECGIEPSVLNAENMVVAELGLGKMTGVRKTTQTFVFGREQKHTSRVQLFCSVPRKRVCVTGEREDGVEARESKNGYPALRDSFCVLSERRERQNPPVCRVKLFPLPFPLDVTAGLLAPLCGRNRGIFVLDPPDGHTYGCVKFPMTSAWGGVKITDANAIAKQYEAGNLTSAETLQVFDRYVGAVYDSSPDAEKDPKACDAGGLTSLQGDECEAVDTRPWSKVFGDAPVRAATASGLFTPAAWASDDSGETSDPAAVGGAFCEDADVASQHLSAFYTAQDFLEMRAFGLNAWRLPLPAQLFDDERPLARVKALLEAVAVKVSDASDAGLALIVSLEGPVRTVAVLEACASFWEKHGVGALLALEFDASQLDDADRAVLANATLLPESAVLMERLGRADDLVAWRAFSSVASVPFPHAATPVDVASDTAVDDRTKLFFHEATACAASAYVDFARCRRSAAVLVTGASLAIDDCAHDDAGAYGECARLADRTESAWWTRHQRSFAKRQFQTYERGLGWSWDHWQLTDLAERTLPLAVVQQLSLKAAHTAGLVDAFGEDADDEDSALCLHAPVADFALGDATLAPVAAYHWVPPPPTPAPTPQPHAGMQFTSPECHRWRDAILGAVAATLVLGTVAVFYAARRPARSSTVGYQTLEIP